MTYVGGFGPHKNLERLVRVFATLSRLPEFDDVRLVMVGEFAREVFHRHFGAIRALVAELGIDDRVIFTGYLPDEELVVLLNRSTVLVLPSLMEGFGLPAVEAAACGCPVVATTASPLPDVLGEGGLYTDPGSTEQLEQASDRSCLPKNFEPRMRACGPGGGAATDLGCGRRQLQSVIRKVVPR